MQSTRLLIFYSKVQLSLVWKITIDFNVTAKSDSISITANHHPSTCNRSEDGNSCETYEGAKTDNITHTKSEGESLTTPYLRSIFISMN